MRIFTAIPFSQSVQQLLGVLTQARNVKGRWEKPNNYHITLRFIGDVDEDTCIRYVTALKTVHVSAFDFVLQGIGRFPLEAKRPPRVLWVGIAPSDGLTALYEAVSSVLEANGLPKDRHDLYHPHVTLARFHDNHPSIELDRFLEQHAAFKGESMRVDAFVLYQSTITPQGATYQEIERFPLQRPSRAE